MSPICWHAWSPQSGGSEWVREFIMYYLPLRELMSGSPNGSYLRPGGVIARNSARGMETASDRSMLDKRE